MAQVTMDITELDKLRQDLKDRDNEIKEIQKELYEVRADKRVLRVTQGIENLNLIAYVPKNMSTLESIKIKRNEDNEWDYLNKSNSFVYPFKYYIGIKPKKELVNFEDVKDEIRKDLENKYAEEIDELRTLKAEGQKSLNALRIQKNNEITELTNGHFAEILELNNTSSKEKLELQKKIDELQKEINEVRTGVKEQTEKEYFLNKIKELEANLYKEQSKSWWIKLIKK